MFCRQNLNRVHHDQDSNRTMAAKAIIKPPQITFTRAPRRARSLIHASHQSPRQVSDRRGIQPRFCHAEVVGSNGATQWASQNTERNTRRTYDFRPPVFLSLSLFDKAVFFVFVLSSIPFFRALGGIGVMIDDVSASMETRNSSNDPAQLSRNATVETMPNANLPIGEEGQLTMGRNMQKVVRSSGPATYPPTTDSGATATLLHVMNGGATQASPIDLPWPLATPNVDHIFDYGSPGDIPALRIHLPGDSQHVDLDEMGWGRHRQRTRAGA